MTADNSHSSPGAFFLPRRLVERVFAEARRSPQVEVCGLIGVRDGTPTRCYPVPNVAREPARFFEMDPRGQIDALRDLRERGEELFAIYHSHPHGPAEPSDEDLRQAAWPGVLYLIVSLDGDAGPQLRGYRLQEGAFQPVALEF